MLYKISILRDGECLTQVAHIPPEMMRGLVISAQQRPDANQIVVSDGIGMVFVWDRREDGAWLPSSASMPAGPLGYLSGTPPTDERSKP